MKPSFASKYSTSAFTVAAEEPISFAMRVFAQPCSASSRTCLRRLSRAVSVADFFGADFLPFAVPFPVDFALALPLRPRLLLGPAARFSASRRNASSAEMVFGSYCLGSERFVSPSVMYAP